MKSHSVEMPLPITIIIIVIIIIITIIIRENFNCTTRNFYFLFCNFDALLHIN